MHGVRLTVPDSKLLRVDLDDTLDEVTARLGRVDAVFVYMQDQRGRYCISPSQRLMRLAQDPPGDPASLDMQRLSRYFEQVEDAPVGRNVDEYLERAKRRAVIFEGEDDYHRNHFRISEDLVQNPDWSAAAAEAMDAGGGGGGGPYGPLPNMGMPHGAPDPGFLHDRVAYGDAEHLPHQGFGHGDSPEKVQVFVCVCCTNAETVHCFTPAEYDALPVRAHCPHCGNRMRKIYSEVECHEVRTPPPTDDTPEK